MRATDFFEAVPADGQSTPPSFADVLFGEKQYWLVPTDCQITASDIAALKDDGSMCLFGVPVTPPILRWVKAQADRVGLK